MREIDRSLQREMEYERDQRLGATAREGVQSAERGAVAAKLVVMRGAGAALASANASVQALDATTVVAFLPTLKTHYQSVADAYAASA